MSYSITLRNKKIYSLPDADALSLKDTLASLKTTIMVELGEDMVRSNEIVTITRNKYTAADLPVFPADRQIAQGTKCRGVHSIQKEIHQIALRVGNTECEDNPNGRRWSQLVQDRDWRMVQYRKLKAIPGSLWCDGGQCYCD